MQANRIAKLAVASLMLVGFVNVSSAILAVDWKALEGFFKFDGVTPLLGDAGTQTALAQLIFTADGIIDPVDPSAPHYIQAGGDDVWLADWTIDTSFSSYGEFQATPAYTSVSYMAGALYIRVFDQGSMSGLTNGMNYFNSALTNTIDNTSDPMNPNLYDFSLLSPEFGDRLDQTVVPEPATWAFLFIGLAALAGRKFRRG